MRHAEFSRVVSEMRLPRRRLVLAVAAACVTLLAALSLSAVSAWLITRAWQMPPVLTLSIAITGVRAFGVTRGVFRYLDRLLAHDVGLAGVVALRGRVFERIASSPRAAERVVRIPRGDLVQRLGADADAVGDAVVRGYIPTVVAGVMVLAPVGLIATHSLPAAAFLLVGLAVATWLVPALAERATLRAEAALVDLQADQRADVTATLDAALPLRLAGRLAERLEAISTRQRDIERTQRRSARGLAYAAALSPVAQGIALVGGVWAVLPALSAGDLNAPWFTIVCLVPLAAFEAASALPAAATALVRGRAAARRLAAVLDLSAAPGGASAPGPASAVGPATAPPERPGPTPAGRPPLATAPDAPAPAFLTARGLAAGHDHDAVRGIDLTLNPGDRVCLTGPSGSGKTSLLLTLSGLLPARAGTVLTRHAEPQFFAEDAHLFATTLRENLLLAQGDATEADLLDALTRVGLGPWLEALPDGLDTDLTSQGGNVSGGQRRRLLLARALLSRSAVVLLDEPTEHLDDASAAHLLRAILDGDLFGRDQAVVVVTHAAPPEGATARPVSFPTTMRIHDYARSD
ncbi:thiol reductant ABC exporter subunit CydC [Micrococcales bacterium 31B]|nr:thiol reductant ABC exporter subunit CydC [Micrococcales bacterium 31B]